jgi:pilus assembly protein Flp/PilA
MGIELPSFLPTRSSLDEERKTQKQEMKRMLNTYAQVLKGFVREEQGQDLIEYALVVALIAFAATAGMSAVANKINTAFTNIGSKLNVYTS